MSNDSTEASAAPNAPNFGTKTTFKLYFKRKATTTMIAGKRVCPNP